MGDYETAHSHGDWLIEDDPASVNGWTTRIIAHHQMGNMTSAREAAAALIERVPDFSTERFLISRMLAKHPIGERPRASLMAVNLPD